MANLAHPDGTEYPAGRYEFKDNGVYIGEWFKDKACGLGLITKDKSQGEFTGLWSGGCEQSGIFIWPNAPGAMYEGDWAKTKRHGYGIFTREDWVIMGQFKEDFIVVGVKCKEHSIGRYEGEFDNGLPNFGVETYADGGSYAGEYKNGIRNGLGVRTSIPYGEVFSYFPEVGGGNRTRSDSLTSQRSGHDIDGPIHGNHTADAGSKHGTLMKMSTKFKCGFVLSGQRSDLLIKRLRKDAKRRQKKMKKSRSLGSALNQKLHRKQDHDIQSTRSGPAPGRHGFEGSFRSAHSGATYNTLESAYTNYDWQPPEDSIDPEAIETYSGEWLQDIRQGHGVCERSDGVRYEGQWLNNVRNGWGVTHFPDGTLEAGRYENGKMVLLSGRRTAFLFAYSFHVNRMIENHVKKAKHAAHLARGKAEEAHRGVLVARDAVNKAQKCANTARDYSLETRDLVQELYPDFEQPGIRYLRDIVRMMKVTKRCCTAFEITLAAAVEALEEANRSLNGSFTEGDIGGGGTHLLTVGGIGGGGSRRSSRRGSFRGSFRRSRKKAHSPMGDGNVKTVTDGGYPMGNSLVPPGEEVIMQQKVMANMASAPSQSMSQGTKVQMQQIGSPTKMAVPSTATYVSAGGLTPILYDPGAEALQPELMVAEENRITTVLLPIPKLTSKSAIPTVQLKDLLNTTLLTDHFDHYGTLPPGGLMAHLRSTATTDGIGTNPNAPITPTAASTVAATPAPKTPTSPQKMSQTVTSLLAASNSTATSPSGSTLQGRLLSPDDRLGGPSESSQITSQSSSQQQVSPSQEPRISRRRTMPSIMTAPPIKPVSTVPAADEEKISWELDEAVEVVSTGTPSQKSFTSNEYVYIIENGVRKRVRARRESSRGSTTTTGGSSRLFSGATSTIASTFQDELSPLPRNYRFESQMELRKDLGEGSLPDVSIFERLQSEMPMSRAEMARLSEARKREQKREQDRRMMGEIVIQFSDFKDWVRGHFLLLLVLFMNVGLLALFVILLITPRPQTKQS